MRSANHHNYHSVSFAGLCDFPAMAESDSWLERRFGSAEYISAAIGRICLVEKLKALHIHTCISMIRFLLRLKLGEALLGVV